MRGSLGGDPTRLLRTARIKASAFDQPAAFISFGAMSDLLERSAVNSTARTSASA
jgi:hypothetical protein